MLIAATALVCSGVVGGLVANSTGSAGAATSSPTGLVVTSAGRVLDTRLGSKPAGGSTLIVATGISGADAVAVNITITDTAAAGYVTAWSSDTDKPNASIINSSAAGDTVANYAVVPVDSTGHFNLYTSQAANLIVDLMGYFPSPSATDPFPSGTVTSSSIATSGGLSAVITSQTVPSSSTVIVGTVTNGLASTVSVRIEIRCADNNVAAAEVYGLTAGETRPFNAFCSGNFTSGATVERIVTI